MSKPRSSLRFRIGLCTGLALLALWSSDPAPARAMNPYLEIPPVAEAEDSPAFHYANLSNERAYAELVSRGIPFRREPQKVPGVRAPIRLTGPLNGVHIRSVLPPKERATSPFEILDARLALALDDLTLILAAHDVVEVVHFTMYRPPGKVPENPGEPQMRHPGGMAIDLGAMKKRDGSWLAVGPHWSSSIGSKTCGPDARELLPRRGRELISMMCEAADQRIFHYMLSPHFDHRHHDHLHLEIKPGVRWFLAN